MHKTPSEGKEIIDQILENTSFVEPYAEPLQKTFGSSQEEPSIVEPEPDLSTSLDSTEKSSPEPSTSYNEEI